MEHRLMIASILLLLAISGIIVIRTQMALQDYTPFTGTDVEEPKE